MGSTKVEATTAAPKNGKPYGQIILTLKNQLLPEEKLACTPSQLDGLDADTETDLRIYGCELIQTAGILLKLPQVAMATGQVLLQRFYYSRSMVRHPVEHTAMACVCLASKIEEAPRDARHVINVFTHIRQVNSNKPIAPVILDKNYGLLKNQVISAERRVLKELGFCVHIKHPHKIIVMYLQVLCLERHGDLMQYSWNYMNDSLRTDVFVRYQPETVACACIYLTARKLKLPLPKHPAWYTIFGARERDIRDVCVRILKLYNRPKPNVDELQKRVDELRRKYQDAKMRAKGAASGANTPNHCSPASDSTQTGATTTTTTTTAAAKTTGAHNAWGGFISRSGSHVVPPISSNAAHAGAEKKSRSRTRSPSASPKHHKRSKKHKASRSRSPPAKRKGHKRRSYTRSRSRSNSPHKRKNRERRKSRSLSNDRENRNDSRYIDRYDKYDRYKDDRYDEKEPRSKKYERDGEKDRYSRRNKHRDDDKDARDRDRSKDERSKDRRR